ncbi:transporter substrate-binding domain-containing protein [Magnetospira thiophila]
MALLAPVVRAADDPVPLRIAISDDYPPFSIVNQSGGPFGLLVDIWRAWSKATGRPITFVSGGWSWTLEALKNGEADIHSGLNWTEERATFLDFSEPIYESRSTLFTFNTDAPVTLENLVGKKVGVVKDTVHDRFLTEQHPTILRQAFDDNQQTINALLLGKVDAILSESVSIQSSLARLGLGGALQRSDVVLYAKAVHAGVAKGNQALLKQINEGLQSIPVATMAEIESRWLPNPADHFYVQDKNRIALSTEEQAWISANPSIRLAVTTFIEPVDIFDQNGGYSGLNPQLMVLLGQKTGLEIKPEFFSKWSDLVDSTLTGKVDGALSFSITPERQAHVQFTKPYAYDPVVIITRNSREDISARNDLRGKRVTAVEGLAWIDEIKADIGDGELVIVADDGEGLAKVAAEDVDAHVTSLILFNSAQKRQFVPGLKVAGSRNTEGGSLRLAVHNSKPLLFNILEKALNALTEDELRTLRDRWLAPKGDPGAVLLSDAETDWLRTHPVVDLAMMDSWPPVSYVDSLGRPQGVSVALVEALNTKLGGVLRLRPGPWKENLAAVAEKRLPALLDITPNPAREASYNFTTPYLSIPHVFVARKDVEYIADEGSLNGKILALERGFGNVKWFRENHPEIIVQEYDDTSTALGAVSRGEAVAYAGNRAVAMHIIEEELIGNLAVHGRVDKPASVLTIGVRKDWPILRDILQKALNALTETERRAILRAALMQSESEKQSTLPLTNEERQWLKAHPVVRVHNETTWAPFNFSENGTPKGYSIDYMNLLAERLGIKVEYVTGPTWNEFMDMIRGKRLDVMLNIVKTEDREKFILFTPPYVDNPPVIITRLSSDLAALEDLNGQSVCIPEGFFYQEILQRKYQEIPLVLATDQVACLRMVSDGRAEATIAGVAIQAHLIAKLFLSNLKVAGGIDDPDLFNQLRIGVRQDWPELRDILEKAIASVSEDDLRPLRERWMSAEAVTQPAEDQQTETSKLVFVTLAAVVGLILLLALLQWVIRRWVTKDASKFFEGEEIKRTGALLVGIYLLAVVVAAWLMTASSERDVRREMGSNLKTVLQMSHEALKIWAAGEMNAIDKMVQDPELVRMTEELLLVPRDAKALRNSMELNFLRLWMERRFFKDSGKGFHVIAPDGISIGSLQDFELATGNPIAARHKALLDQVFKGQTKFIPPLLIPSNSPKAGEKALLFFAAPIRDDTGSVIAVLAVARDPAEDFTRITRLGRLGLTGETYALDQDGILNSASRFDADLQKIGLIGEQEAALLHVKIRDPGRDLTGGQEGHMDPDSLPPTLAAQGIKEGRAGLNIEGYRDYRGVRVLGAWVWDADLRIGLATEIDEAEALGSFWNLRRTMMIVLAATVLTALGLGGLSVWIGQSATRSLTKSRDAANEARLRAEEARAEAEAAEELLRKNVAEIERFNRLAMGREQRIIELKGQINQLSLVAGQETPFQVLDGSDEPPLEEDESPETALSIAEIMDLKHLQELLENFCAAVGIASAIIDLKGNVLAAARWQRACTDFHRVHEESCARCIESDTDLALHLQKGKDFAVYRCKNGLTDAASPIIIEGEHVANVFIGQFLLQEPDRSFFAEQARTFGFDEQDYLSAIGDVPVVTEAKLPNILGFLAGFSRLIGSLSIERLKAEKSGEVIRRERVAAMNLAEDAEFARAELAEYKDQLEDLVEERTSRLRSIIDTAVDGVIVINQTGLIESFSPAAEKMFGYTADEVMGQNVTMLMPEPFKGEHDSYLQRYMSGKSAGIVGSNREVIGQRKDGSTFPIDLAIGEAQLADEWIFTGMVRDITERKRAEQELAEEKARLQNILDQSPVSIAFSTKGRVHFANPLFIETFGAGPGDESPNLYVDPGVREGLVEALTRDGIVSNREIRMYDRHKQIRDLLITYQPITFGGEEGILGWLLDITKRKRAEAELARTEEQNRLLLESVGDGIFGTDENGKVIFVNGRALDLLGYDRESLMGHRVHEIIHHSHLDGSPYPVEECPMWHAYSKGEASHIDDEVLWRKDGSSFAVEYSASPMMREGETIGSVVAFRDISERKEAQAKLAEAYAIISSSIDYAANIQRAVLTGDELLAATTREHLVLWKPRDVVGGDIYWCHIWGNGLLVILGDCTGHGVPGAFMTLIASGALDQAMGDVPPGQVATLIQRMHQIIQVTLGQHGAQGDSDDGLELGACYINESLSQMSFSGARFPLFVVRDGEVVEYKGTKKGIGYRQIPHQQTYDQIELSLEDEATYYMTSDGFLDQVGGEKNQMFGKRRFKQLLLDLQDRPVHQQMEPMMQALADYQGTQIRRDDVSVIGFKL